MAIYSLGQNTTVTTVNAPAMDCKAGVNNPRIMEIGISLTTATASIYGLTRSTNVPSQTAPVLLQAEYSADPASLTAVAVAWGTAPTIGGTFIRRINVQSAVGAGIVWTFPRGIAIPNTYSLVIWNLSTNSASANIWWVADE